MLTIFSTRLPILFLLDNASAYKPVTGHVIKVSGSVCLGLGRIYYRLEIRNELQIV